MENKNTTYEYGAMSSRFKLTARNKLTAYATMCLHYRDSAHLMVIYKPESCKKDSWTNFTGETTQRLDDVFGGVGKFEEYLKDNIDEIRLCYKSIKRLV